jgi:hypothetical protein
VVLICIFGAQVNIAEGGPYPRLHYVTSTVDRGWLSTQAINTVLFTTNTFGVLAQVGQGYNLFSIHFCLQLTNSV